MARVKSDQAGAVRAARLNGDQQSRDSAEDWHILLIARPNVLVAGAPDTVEQSLSVLMPRLDPPVRCWSPDAALPSPLDLKTLVIRGVNALSAEQQRDLLSWLERAAGTPIRVVSTTTVPLFQRVAAGLFLDVLYYRLNTVLLDMTDTRVTDSADDPRAQPA